MSLFSVEAEFDAWFESAVGSPTAVQRAAWPVLRAGRHAMVVSSTGSGKTLAAWRPLVEGMVRRRSTRRRVRALHVAPLKALSRDMTLNLAPLLAAAGRLGGTVLEIALRCGDTPPAERMRQSRRPPEVLATTPETLYVLLGSRSGRAMLRGVEAVVVDEVHALAGGKRGAHLALSLERLDECTGRPVQRIGLSATARPAAELAALLTGGRDCEIVEPSAPRAPRVRIELGAARLGPFPTLDLWRQVHDRVVELGRDGGSTLVFCQTRAQVERTALELAERLGDEAVGAHHGSLDTAHRERVERRFKEGAIRWMVSSASLELGLDLGAVDRVCQLGPCGSANLLRQRAGRSGHRPGSRAAVHLFPLTPNQRVEAEAVAGLLDAGVIEDTACPPPALDVLAQHIVAAVSCGASDPDALYALARRAWPWRDLARERFEAVVDMLAESPERMPGPQRAALLRRRGASLVAAPGAASLALRNAGAIPEWFEYDVVRAENGKPVGRLDEEFAFESSPGQVLQLGNRAWRILRVLPGQVLVEPSDDEAAHLPFWFGEGPGRSDAVSEAVLQRIAAGPEHAPTARLLDEAERVLGVRPGPRRLVIERFADPAGDRHLVLHTFAGARINRAWGLALRKRFCRQFNFELQAAATDDGILISLGVTSEFRPGDVVRYVSSGSVEGVLTQALLDTPLFLTRFRWCANHALLLPRADERGPVPPQRQRSQAENLVACVFPDQLACLENLSGPREVPDHPLVGQALHDCLHDIMDLPGLRALLERIESGRIEVVARDLARPSPLAEALIHAPRTAFLDEAAA
ncbi:MAG: DEAD/DEAH box helicase, partial [Wenzhouxiangellaceae bacterium]|nr:DEAD/DEAH box helicase [Wenzhouxiangellaceae bacterium]